MANLVWEILWVVAALVAGGLMFAAWTGPHRSVSNISRWAARLHIRPVPLWLSKRDADRWAFRGGLISIVLLLAAAWLIPSQQAFDVPVSVPDNSGNLDSKSGVAPAQPDGGRAIVRRPDRHIDAELKNAILVHVPKTKQIRLVVLSGDPEPAKFAWEIDAYLKFEGYKVISPHLLFMMRAGAETPSGTTIYPDEKDPNILVIRIGQNDRSE